ncbi:helix-turn-helix domain containing protein [Segeticoccus rhizosphaerae]|uniref:helix-turn-helix domain containing protein n=1 Tax=Segeticoccus rhizosphaerae TaxID=1104777 RepID=UPI001265937C|nr:helix-turn-helix domain containing protein [Segeticoccus rhizosphaerae]
MSTTYTASCPTCGYTTSPSRSEAQASYGIRRHSCDRQRKIAERAARVAARKTSSGTKRECHCPIARHQHGTHVAYVVDKCRCRECRDAAAAYERERLKQDAYGRWQPYVPAGHARAHVLRLGAQGMGWKRVARAAGLSESIVWKLVYGDRARNMPPSKRIRPATEAKILAVELDLAHGAFIDGTGTRRRLQALTAIGWSQSELGRRLGIERGNMYALIHGTRRTHVTVATARKVAMLYDQLWNKPPQPREKFAKIARANALRAARRNGWVGPLAWDDDTIDDPNATPDLGEHDTTASYRKVHADDVEFLVTVHSYGKAELLHHLHTSWDTVTTNLDRAGRRDLLDLIHRNDLSRGSAA